MKTGMLWFDDSSRALREKVKDAADYYLEKYGQKPTLCLVNPITLNGRKRAAKGIEMRGVRTVMPDHFLLGVNLEGSVQGNGRQN
ncbi:MAG: hypothetical protein GTO18_12260 [Anaerolineales bacterium]|nr:hypothetical protein [Anaerolineales bacterium]